MKYDMWKHGIDVRVYDSKRNLYGTVKDIRETAYEWIEPFVLFDGEDQVMITNPDDLEVINEANNNTQR